MYTWVADEEVGLVLFFWCFLTTVLLMCKYEEFVIDLSNFVTASHNVRFSFHIIRFVWSVSSLGWSSSRTKWGKNVIKFTSKSDYFYKTSALSQQAKSQILYLKLHTDLFMWGRTSAM